MTEHDGVSIRGGAGSTQANLDQLTRAAERLDAAAQAFGRVEAATASAHARLQRTAWVAPHTGQLAVNLAGELRSSGSASLHALAVTASGLGDDIRAARDMYTGAESLASRILSGAKSAGALPGLALVLELGRLLGTGSTSNEFGDHAARAVANLAWLFSIAGKVAGILGLEPSPHARAGNHVAGISPLFAAGVDLFVPPQTYEFTGGDSYCRPATGSSLVNLVLRTGEEHTDSSAQARDDALVVQVDKVTKPDGSIGWLVALPGMQVGGEASHSLDSQEALRLVSGQESTTVKAVADALAASGAGSDEPVVLAGHSAGGLLAVAFARSSHAQDYNVKAVLTAGSPTAGMMTPPSGVQVMHLRNRRDAIAALAGADDEVAPNRTTIEGEDRLPEGQYYPTATNPSTTEPDSPIRYVSDRHRVAAYADIAAQAEELRDNPSIAAFQGVVEAAIGGPGARAETREYEVRLTPIATEESLKLGELKHGVPPRLD